MTLGQRFINAAQGSCRLYRINGQSACRIEVEAGETLTISSFDGLQGCEILAFYDQLKPSILNAYQASPAHNAFAQLEQNTQSALALKALLDNWEITLESLNNAYHFTADNLPSLTFDTNAIIVILCCGKDMTVEQQTPVTELNVKHYFTHQEKEYLPNPLANIVNEYRVASRSAKAYLVKKGEWIQIIDVKGKQCSDFVALDYQALLEGQEIGLDAAATRTTMGRTTPQPGLHSKFSDPSQQTMLELVQDTVGCHDSFLFACNAKFYEDLGYFGHVNCTDNINAVFSEYGVSPRTGWPAINFFFNTSASDCGAIDFHEPMSRAGDYVLIRATRDLLCATTACPDDIDPANAWRPTDIHVRIYGSEEEFPRSIGHRLIPEELPRMTKQTGFHTRTAQLTKRFVEYRGYWVAAEYENWGAKSEYLACRERVAMIDLTPLRKIEVLGPDAEQLLQMALTRNVRRVAVGEIVYSAMCHETGGMIDDGTLFRLSEQTFRWICGDSYGALWLRELAEKNGMKVAIQESTEQIHNVALQGPKSRELLNNIIWTPEHQISVNDLQWFHFLVGRLGGENGIPLMISRTGYTGELGFEVWCHPDKAPQVWDAIWAEGEQFQIAPLGFDALDTLRIEAGLIFADHEFCPETNPFEAGIGFTTPLKTQQEDFIGRSAIEQQAPASRKRLVGLTIKENELVSHGDQVFNGRYPVGVITSATMSPLLNSQIAMCRIAPEFAEAGTELEIGQLDGHIKRIKATVCPLPFYDPERKRVRS